MKNSFLIEITENPSRSRGVPRYSIEVVDLKDKIIDVDKRDFSRSTLDSDFLFNPLGQLGVALARRFEHNTNMPARMPKHKKGRARQKKLVGAGRAAL